MCRRLTASDPAKVKKNWTKIWAAAQETEFVVWVWMCVTCESLFTENSAIFSLASDTRYVNMLFSHRSVARLSFMLRSQFTVVGLRRQARGLKYLELVQSLIQGRSLIWGFKADGSATIPTSFAQLLVCEDCPHAF